MLTGNYNSKDVDVYSDAYSDLPFDSVENKEVSRAPVERTEIPASAADINLKEKLKDVGGYKEAEELQPKRRSQTRQALRVKKSLSIEKSDSESEEEFYSEPYETMGNTDSASGSAIPHQRPTSVRVEPRPPVNRLSQGIVDDEAVEKRQQKPKTTSSDNTDRKTEVRMDF